MLKCFNCIALAHRADADLLNNILIFGSELAQIEIGSCLLQLLLHILEKGLVLDRTLIKFLLRTLLSDGLVCNIIELGNLRVADLAVGRGAEHLHDLGSLCLEVNNLVSHLSAQVAIFQLHGILVQLLDMNIQSLDLLKAIFSLLN